MWWLEFGVTLLWRTSGAQCTAEPALPDDSYSSSGQVLPSTRRLSFGIWVQGTLASAVLKLWSLLEASGDGRDVPLLLWVSLPRHSWLEARLGKALRHGSLKLETPPHLVVVAS